MANFIPGYEDSPEFQDIQRQRKYADLLRQQAFDPMKGQMVGQTYVAPSITQGLAKLFQGYQAGQVERGANDKQKALADMLRGQRDEWINSMPQPSEVQKFGGDGMGPPQVTTQRPSDQDYLSWAAKGMGIDPNLASAGFRMADSVAGREDRNASLKAAQEFRAQQAEAERAARAEQANANREQRTQEMKMRSEDMRLSQQERLAAQRQLAQMQIDAKRDMFAITQGQKKDLADANKKQQLDQQSISAQQAIDQAAALFAHPGRESGTGMSSWSSIIPGTDAKGFKANLDTFKAQTFIPMVSALKGMGALSDAEGKKLSDSVGALDPSMKESEFAESLKKVTRTLYQKAKASGLNVSLPDFAIDASSGAILPKDIHAEADAILKGAK